MTSTLIGRQAVVVGAGMGGHTRGARPYNNYLDQLKSAETIGYDGLRVNQHHADAYV